MATLHLLMQPLTGSEPRSLELLLRLLRRIGDHNCRLIANAIPPTRTVHSVFKSFSTIDETLPCLAVGVEWNHHAISIMRTKVANRANLPVVWMAVERPHVVEVYQRAGSDKPIKPT